MLLLLLTAETNIWPDHLQDQMRQYHLVEISTLDNTIKFDIKYATTDNILKKPLYLSARAFLRKEAAEALVRVHNRLKKNGLGLIVYDAYRPLYVSRILYEAAPLDKKCFFAPPEIGSSHNCGCGVDVSLYDLKTGKSLSMPCPYDELSERASVLYRNNSLHQRLNRIQLQEAMESEGFRVYLLEWWHFDYKNWKKYPLLNVELKNGN